MNDTMHPQPLAGGQPAAVTPPPRDQQHDAPAHDPATPTSPTLAERAAALGLDENVTRQLTSLVEGLSHPEEITDDVLSTLARGISHDDDVQNADAAGYLRGRNEKIEAVMPPEPDNPPEDPQPVNIFPRYCRRSIWD